MSSTFTTSGGPKTLQTAARTSSPPLPYRRAPLEERGGAFLGVVAREDLGLQLAGAGFPALRVGHAQAYELLDRGQAEWSVGRKAVRVRERGGHHLVRGDDRVHEPHRLRAIGGDEISREGQLEREGHRDARREHRAAAGREEPALHLGE